MTDDGFNTDGSLKPWKAAQTVARLKVNMRAPYYLQHFAPSGTPQNISSDEFLKRFMQFPADIQAQGCKDFTELLKVARSYLPVGEWLFTLTGTVAGASQPIAFVDTPILEKAISYHISEGHGGTI